MSPTLLLLLGFCCEFILSKGLLRRACRRTLLYFLFFTHHSSLIIHHSFLLWSLLRRFAPRKGLSHLINKVIVLKLSCYLFQIIRNTCIHQLISCLDNKTTNDIFIHYCFQFYILHFSC